MDEQTILTQATQRVQAKGKHYAGDLSPEEAHFLLQRHPHAKLVDVRSHPELEFSGFVEGCCHIPWKLYPGMVPNPDFDQQIDANASPEDWIFLLCRTGGRSEEAAEHLWHRGFQHAFNILGGFEGKPDPLGQRGKLEGWKAAGLPWRHP
ncbi:MAG: rhodanese-like domain-containing protein [Acidithiobacillus sp.]|nr:rhodanese-like domain-containing protein [Acidithiobacillus sp.]